MTDNEIIKLVLSGGREPYAELIRRHQAHVLGLCRGLLGDPAQAEDAAQDVFVKTFKLLSKFKGQSTFSTWLYRLTTNHCLDLLRKPSNKKVGSLDDLMDSGFEIADPMNLEKLLEMRDLSARLMAGLSESERSALVLRESEGLSYEEIGDVLGISLDAVKSRLKRARESIEKKVRHFLRLENV